MTVMVHPTRPLRGFVACPMFVGMAVYVTAWRWLARSIIHDRKLYATTLSPELHATMLKDAEES